MARASVFMIGWLLPAAAFGTALLSDGLYVATRSLFWWACSQGALSVGIASACLGLLMQGWRSPHRPLDASEASKLGSAALVLAIAGLVNAALALGLRALAPPPGPFAWLALYLTGASSLLLVVAGALAWRGRRLRG